MNVAIFASAFHPSLGGVEEVVRQVAHEYARLGIGTVVLTNRWPRSLPQRDVVEGIPVYRLAMRLPEYTLRIRMNYWLTRALTRGAMLRILRSHRTDLVHVHCVSSNAHYALMAREALGVPLVVTAHGERTIDAGRVYEKSAMVNKLLRKVLREAHHVTACSNATLRDLEEYFGATLGSRASTIYSGIRVKEFSGITSHDHGKPYILGMGRLVPQKGFDVLIEAFARAELATHDLLIAGEGPERKRLEELTKELALQDRVHLVGRADRKMAAGLFKGCSFFVLPSRDEPMGIVNLEAMAAGKAVIATRVGGVPEIVIDRKTGVLVEPGNLTAIAAAIRCFGTDPELCARLGRAGQQRAQAYDWSRIAAQYVRIYEEALANGPRAEAACRTEALSPLSGSC